ncbi:BMC domain-containing protein [Desulfosporosinus sp. BG]|uniref:BMC domain-containing protein n=1 Tax=Desulfosporosinus sp. BG TaxID=1633135 RepID=UPI00083ACA74|nr:BMC domain-containing protein [Desulfosporosinus sp. BG]ODA39617.1 Ethanolamine utilization protein [Desulfosporosinus sp. BG]
MQALGLIETRGLVPAIEAADVMLKTAQVEFLGRTYVGSGLVTITVTGDVGAVKAAVEAGVTAVEKIGHLSLVSHQVIPRPHLELETIVGVMVSININDPLPSTDTVAESKEQQITKGSTNPAKIILKQLRKDLVDAYVQEFGLEKSLDALKSHSVLKLRNLAREYKGLSVAGRAISKANKESLILKLKEYYEQEQEIEK